jgi:hypothetical protein
MISHSDVREALELAAVEPGGLDRLMAGDTPNAVLVAGHLAGCDSCTAEFGRLSRSAAVLLDTIATQPPPELRERTLAFVRAVGRPRGLDLAAAAADPAVPAADAAAVAAAMPELPMVRRAAASRPIGLRLRDALRPGTPVLTWIVATAAVTLIAVTLTAGLVSSRRDSGDQPPTNDAAALAQVTQWSIRIAAQADAVRVVLTSGSGSGAVGTLEFSPSSREVVVVADGLVRPAAGQQYGCWVLINGQRQRLGPMFFNGSDIAYWVGDVDLLADVPAGSTFGVSLIDPGGTVAAPDPVLSGML